MQILTGHTGLPPGAFNLPPGVTLRDIEGRMDDDEDCPRCGAMLDDEACEDCGFDREDDQMKQVNHWEMLEQQIRELIRLWRSAHRFAKWQRDKFGFAASAHSRGLADGYLLAARWLGKHLISLRSSGKPLMELKYECTC